MRNKKLLSTVVATAMIATMAMPVMAADGGEVDVDVQTKTAIIRVEVPTSLEVAVNQFEKEDAGSQIYSADFPIKNKSEIPVKVNVKSTATLATTTPIKLEATKKAAEESKATEGAAWLAVAAQTSSGKYIEDAGKGIKDLTEASANVTTFVQGTDTEKSSAEASQVFYLSKAAASNVAYKGFIPSADGKVDNVSYAQFYKIDQVTLSNGSEQADLDTAIAAGDVYEVASTITDINGTALTLTAKKGGSATVETTGKTYYKAATEPTAKADLKNAEKYVYGEDNDGGAAAFRFIGKLSESKETWTAEDIKKIKIAYDIVGVTDTKYNEISTDTTKGTLTYGYYKEKTAPTVPTTTATSIAAGGAAVEFTVPNGVTVSSVEKTKADGTYNTLPTEYYEWEDVMGGKKLTLKETFTSTFGAGKKIKVTFSAGDPFELSVQ